LLALLALPLGLQAISGQTTYFAPADIVQPELGIPVDPRAIGMGEAFTAVADDAGALEWNPAGLALLENPQLSFMHNEWNTSLGIRQEYLAGAEPLGPGGVGVDVDYFNLGSFNNTDSNGNLIDTSSDYDISGSLGYGMELPMLLSHLYAGAVLQYSQETFDSASDELTNGGLGLLYQWTPKLRLGASLLHLGNGPAGTQLPGAGVLGASYRTLHDNLLLSGELYFPYADAPGARAGFEWSLFSEFFLRAGYIYSSNDNSGNVDSGFTAGLGALLGPFQVDYAFVPYGSLGSANRIALTLTFSPDMFGSKIILEAGDLLGTAQASFDQGLKAYQEHDWYTAKVALTNCLKVFPDFPKSADAKAMLNDIDRQIATQKETGDVPEIRKKMLENVTEATQLMDAEKYVEARNKLQAVLYYDPGINEAHSLMEQLDQRVGSIKARNMAKAQEALDQDDLPTAVMEYRAILSILPDDQQAMTKLSNLHQKIEKAIKTLRAQGIDDYVAGKFSDAISAWQKAISLDPSDPQNIKKDMDRAQKMLDLQ
jgi:tetratricopeptide (TPR) repeat protein